MKKRILAMLLAVTLIVTVFAACGDSPKEEPVAEEPVAETPAAEEPEAEGLPGEGLDLIVYACVLEDYMNAALERFSEETGVNAQGVRLGVGETLGRLRAEKENPQADVWFGGSSETFIAAAEDGLLEAYVSPQAADIPEMYKDADGYWTGFYVGYLGFASNERLLAEKGLEVPNSWDALLAPELKGQVSIANPAASGTSYNLLATLVMSLGEDEAIEYMKKLDENVKQYEKSGTAPARLVGQGEAIVGVTYMHDSLKYKEEGLEDIVVSAPESGTGYEIGSMAIVHNGPNPEAAKMFIDWALENAEMGQTVGSYQFLTDPNLKQPEIAEPYKDTPLIDFDAKFAAENRDRLVEKWADAVNQ